MNPSSAMAFVSSMPGAGTPAALSAFAAAATASSFLLHATNRNAEAATVATARMSVDRSDFMK